MKSLRIVTLLALLLGLATFVACGGSSKAQKEEKTAVEKTTPAPEAASAPVYPNCDNDAHCASKGTVCVDSKCVQCREDAQCTSLGVCGRCKANACVKEPGCCGTDADCEAGRCRAGTCK